MHIFDGEEPPGNASKNAAYINEREEIVLMIRSFTKNDFDVYNHMSLEFYNSKATDHQVPESHFRSTFDEIVSGSPLARGWLLFSDSQAKTTAGYMLASLTWSNEFGGRVAWLEEIHIQTEFRGQGLGRKAITSALEELKKEGALGFRLEVAPANSEVAELYRRMGFSPVPYDQWWKTA